MSDIPMPSSDYPSEEDYLAGNISPDWAKYFQAIWDLFNDDQKMMFSNFHYDRQEARDLYGIMRSHNISLSERNAYLKDFPPNAQQLAHLIAIQIETDAPVVEHGKRFTQRKKGSQAAHTKEIYSLAKQHRDKSAKELHLMVKNPIAKKMRPERFATVVSEARKTKD